MIDGKDIFIGKQKFVSNPLPGLLAVRLDRKIIAKSLSGEFYEPGEVESFGRVMNSFSEAEFDDFILKLFSKTMAIVDGNVVHLNSAPNIDTTFAGNSSGLFELIFEVAGANNFSPFSVVGLAGMKMEITDTSPVAETETTENGSQSEMSES